MTDRRARLLALPAAALTLVLLVAWAMLLVLNRHRGFGGASFAYSAIPLNALPALVFVAVGYLVATRRSRNPVGWLMLALGVQSLFLLLEQYGAYTLFASPGRLPGGRAAAVAVKGGWIPSVLALVLITFLFPDGRLPSRRWRVPAAIAVAAFGLGFVAVHLGPLDPPFEAIDNPLDPGLPSTAVLGMAVPIALGAAFGLLSAVAAVVIRFRRSRGDEREQLKWFVFAAAVIPLGIAVHLVAESMSARAVNVVEAVFSAAVAVIPIAIGIAILRYRLYEIDRIISRTLVYGALTVVLGAAYVGLVLAGQAMFSSFAGGSNLAIAVSTLVVAALFLPVRARIQRVVDRRFYRRRYDAQHTLEAFGLRLREELDLETLAAELRSVVGETLQPTHAALWLREER